MNKQTEFLLLIINLIVLAGLFVFTRSVEGYQGVGPIMQIAPGAPKETRSLNATVQTVSSTPVTLAPGQCTNSDATNWAFVQIFDVSGTVSVGSTANVQSYGIPPAGGSIIPTSPLIFNNAVKVAATTTDNGSTNAVTPVTCNWSVR